MQSALVITELILEVQVEQPVGDMFSTAKGDTIDLLTSVDVPRAAEYPQRMLFSELMRPLHNVA